LSLGRRLWSFRRGIGVLLLRNPVHTIKVTERILTLLESCVRVRTSRPLRFSRFFLIGEKSRSSISRLLFVLIIQEVIVSHHLIEDIGGGHIGIAKLVGQERVALRILNGGRFVRHVENVLG
jgi:hypothetical protein